MHLVILEIYSIFYLPEVRHFQFAKVYNCHTSSLECMKTFTYVGSESTMSILPTTPDWCENGLASLKSRCSSGLNGIPSSALIAGRSVICYPLCSILNSSITSSVFPGPWKNAWVKPLHKGGDHVSPSNYCTIFLLPVCSKILETAFRNNFLHIFTKIILLFPYQSGFRPPHSTQTLPLHCLDDWYKALDQKQYVGVVFLDISKAFDTLIHTLLLAKLSQLGLPLLLLHGFDLTFQISLRSLKSMILSLLLVPQGSVLGPSLFSTFINDLPNVLPFDSIALFADNTAIYIVSSNLASLNSSLQRCLDLANLWMMNNGLQLNTSKTKCILLHSARKTVNTCLNLVINGQL